MTAEADRTAPRTPRPEADAQALEWIRLLAAEIGPRRPCGAAERLAAERMEAELSARGLEARIEPFPGFSSFAWPIGALVAAALLPGLMPPHRRLARSALAAGSLGLLATEGSMRRSLLNPLLARRTSQNVVATIEPRERAARTVCLVGHLDTSRSGLMFHPRVSRHVNKVFAVLSAACVVHAAQALLPPRARLRTATVASRALLLAGLALLAERELRGEDVPGANDNASGSAVAAQLALECAAQPLETTRVILLLTGCEESGLLGAHSFVDGRESGNWLFVNFDSVGGSAPLHFVRREGIGARLFDADPQLLRIAEGIAAKRPDLELHDARRPIGMTYDTTPVLAGGGRGVTFIAGNGGIPNYHWPTDTFENIDRTTLARALEAGREMIAAIDRGEAD